MDFVEAKLLAFLGGLTGLLGRVDILFSFLDEEMRDGTADFFTQID